MLCSVWVALWGFFVLRLCHVSSSVISRWWIWQLRLSRRIVCLFGWAEVMRTKTCAADFLYLLLYIACCSCVSARDGPQQQILL